MQKTQGYASVDGLRMYYEIEGTGAPLVYVPAALGVAGVSALPALVRPRSVITVDEHAVEAFRLLPGGELAVIPDAGHFALSSEPERVLPVVERFLAEPATRLPLATAEAGYRPGATR